MARPGNTLTRSTVRPARSARTSTGPWFAAGITGTVDSDPLGVRKSVKNLNEYAARFGARAAHTDVTLYDAVDIFFQDRGAEAFIARTPDATDAALTTALATFARDLGPGQVSAPGRTAPAQQLALAVHAEQNNRIALLDGPNTAVLATLTAAATIAGITQNQERYAALFAPWVTVPPAPGTANRTVPPSPIVAAAMATRDAEGVTPNQPAAGILGISNQGLDVTQNYAEVDRTTLNANGVNLLRNIYGDVRIFGYRTLADPTTDPDWKNLANARLFMAIQAQADAVMDRYVFRQLDGQRLVISEFGGALTGVLLPFWEKGSLYGASPDTAFKVDVGENVNTDATIENGELHANIALRASQFAEEVILELVKVRTTEAVA